MENAGTADESERKMVQSTPDPSSERNLVKRRNKKLSKKRPLVEPKEFDGRTSVEAFIQQRSMVKPKEFDGRTSVEAFLQQFLALGSITTEEHCFLQLIRAISGGAVTLIWA